MVSIIVEKCVHLTSRRRLPPEAIRQAIKDIRFPIKQDQSAKKQALECIKALQKHYKIARGDMRIQISFD